MENLGRGVVALKSEDRKIFVSWRVLGTDDDALAFNLYRVTGTAAPEKLNVAPLTGATHFLDTTFNAAVANAYFVRPVLAAAEQAPSARFTVAATNNPALDENWDNPAGVAIAANMERSLSVPTATSFRNVPAKLLEVNRKVINGYRSRSGQGKVSFTHLIGYAIVRASRITYVGELGWELYIPTEFMTGVYDVIVEAGRAFGLVHAGYHALNSLRMEKGYRHWGHDITDEDTPLEAGLGFAVKLNKPGGFIGRDALLRQKAEGLKQRL
eukprot:gene27922-49662_t